MLDSRTLLVIHFKYSSVYTLIRRERLKCVFALRERASGEDEIGEGQDGDRGQQGHTGAQVAELDVKVEYLLCRNTRGG